MIDSTSQADGRSIMSTLIAPSDDVWNARVTTPTGTREVGTLTDIWSLWRLARRHETVILRGSVSAAERYRDLVVALLLKLGRRRPLILITDATWEPESRALAARVPALRGMLSYMVKFAIRALDGEHVTYAVLSTDEVETFAATWRVPPRRIVFTPFPHTLYDGAAETGTSRGDYLFAGGNSLRDYQLLETAVDGSSVRTTIAADWRPATADASLIAARVSHDEFIRLMAESRACVVPILPAVRSAGQQTYLNAMALGKPVIVTEAPGVRDYITDGVTGWICKRDARALRERIEWVMSDENLDAVLQIAASGRSRVLAEYNEFKYREQLLAIADAMKSSVLGR